MYVFGHNSLPFPFQKLRFGHMREEAVIHVFVVQKSPRSGANGVGYVGVLRMQRVISMSRRDYWVDT